MNKKVGRQKYPNDGFERVERRKPKGDTEGVG